MGEQYKPISLENRALTDAWDELQRLKAQGIADETSCFIFRGKLIPAGAYNDFETFVVHYDLFNKIKKDDMDSYFEATDEVMSSGMKEEAVLNALKGWLIYSFGDVIFLEHKSMEAAWSDLEMLRKEGKADEYTCFSYYGELLPAGCYHDLNSFIDCYDAFRSVKPGDSEAYEYAVGRFNEAKSKMNSKEATIANEIWGKFLIFKRVVGLHLDDKEVNKAQGR